MSTENAYAETQEFGSLLAEARSGSRTGMGELAILVRERLHPFVMRVTFSPDIAEDVLQETLLSLLCGLDGLRDPDRFWPWIYRIAWTKIQNHARSHRLQSSAEALFARSQTDPDGMRGGGDDPLDVQVRNETRQEVANAMVGLSERHREVLHLRYYDQMPYAEMARRTQTTPAHIRLRTFRAKRSLRSRLACCS
jgi:RNA polymerase sigma factor (sigma-70 family)